MLPNLYQHVLSAASSLASSANFGQISKKGDTTISKNWTFFRMWRRLTRIRWLYSWAETRIHWSTKQTLRNSIMGLKDAINIWRFSKALIILNALNKPSKKWWKWYQISSHKSLLQKSRPYLELRYKSTLTIKTDHFLCVTLYIWFEHLSNSDSIAKI